MGGEKTMLFRHYHHFGQYFRAVQAHENHTGAKYPKHLT